MGAPLLKVNGFDFGPYLNLQHEDGFDPLNPERIAPDFSGTPAFREGKAGVGEAVDNRAWVVPLVLEAEDRPALHRLVSQVSALLVKGATVEFAVDAAVDSISYFTLEAGRLDGAFQYYLSVHATTRATLNLWTTSHASTGTQRLVASLPQGSSAVVKFAATGLLGDANPLANLEVRVGSAIASSGRVVGWGFHPHASHNGYREATSGFAQTGATVRGASGAIGSQYTAIPVSPTTASGLSYRQFLDPPDAHIGRHRVFAIGRSGLTTPLAMYGVDRFGAVLGPTAQASQTDVSKWQLIDLGEVQVPARATGQEPVPTQYVDIYAGALSPGGINASPAFHLAGMIFMPLDYGAGILRTRGVAAGAVTLLQDTWSNYSAWPGVWKDGRTADTGQPWTRVGGYFNVPYHSNPRYKAVQAGESAGGNAAGATAFYDVASGAQYGDVSLSAEVALATYGQSFTEGASLFAPSYRASGAYAETWLKRDPGGASKGVWTRLTFGPSQTLQLFAGNGETATVLASAGIASTRASGLYLGQRHTLMIRSVGGKADVYVGTTIGASPVVTASNAMISQLGNPALRLQNGGSGAPANAFGGGPVVDLFTLTAGASPPEDIPGREYFRFESWPEQRSYRGNASVFLADTTADYRGHLPELLPVPSESPVRSSRVVVFQGEIDNMVGNDGPNIALTALERWEYLR